MLRSAIGEGRVRYEIVSATIGWDVRFSEEKNMQHWEGRALMPLILSLIL